MTRIMELMEVPQKQLNAVACSKNISSDVTVEIESLEELFLDFTIKIKFLFQFEKVT